MIQIEKGTADVILGLYRHLTEADRHFQACQSASFRQYVRRLFLDRQTQKGFEALEEASRHPVQAPIRARKGKETLDEAD